MNTLIYMTFISGGLIVFILILAFAIYWQIKEKTTVLHKKSKIENFSKIIQDAPFGLYLQKIAFNKEGEQSESMVIWNKEMIKLFGHCAESISPILEGPSKIQFEDAKDSVLKGLSDVTRNIRFNTIHGNNFDGFIQLQLITIENVQFILGVVVNISELKSAINSGIANHREEKTFLTNISNEICIPLNAVIGLTQLLLKETDIKAISHYAELINKKSIDLKYMITDVLILAKLESNKLQPEKLTMLIHDTIKKSVENAKILAESSGNKSFQYCLPYKTIKQTFNYKLQGFIHDHLLYNAVKLSGKGRVECGMLYEDGKQIIYTYNSFDKPISQENCIDAFYRFTKLNTSIQGIGIGLTICRTITEYLGGSIGFNGDINNGVLLWVEIPAIYSYTGRDEKEVRRIMRFLEARWDGIWFDEKGILHKPKKKGGHV